MKIGIFGGTFDPPHKGHINACNHFLNAFSLDKLFIIPTFLPPHKEILSSSTTQNRFDMAKIAFENLSCKIEVSDIEIRREGKSFTAETISYFVSQGYDNIFFLCGTDMFLTLDEWYKPEYIFEHSTIVCARRKNDNTFEKNIFEKKKQYEQQYNAKIEILNVNIIDVSSSEIREDIAKNKTSKFLTNDVLSYIKNNNLYR